MEKKTEKQASMSQDFFFKLSEAVIQLGKAIETGDMQEVRLAYLVLSDMVSKEQKTAGMVDDLKPQYTKTIDGVLYEVFLNGDAYSVYYSVTADKVQQELFGDNLQAAKDYIDNKEKTSESSVITTSDIAGYIPLKGKVTRLRIDSDSTGNVIGRTEEEILVSFDKDTLPIIVSNEFFEDLKIKEADYADHQCISCKNLDDGKCELGFDIKSLGFGTDCDKYSRDDDVYEEGREELNEEQQAMTAKKLAMEGYSFSLEWDEIPEDLKEQKIDEYITQSFEDGEYDVDRKLDDLLESSDIRNDADYKIQARFPIYF